MIEIGDILIWLRGRRLKKERKQEAEVLRRLFTKSVTIHGRLELTALMKDEDGLPPELRRMLYGLCRDAPIQEWSVWN